MKDLIVKVEKATFLNDMEVEIEYNKYYVEITNFITGKPLKIYLKPTCDYDKRVLKDYYAA